MMRLVLLMLSVDAKLTIRPDLMIVSRSRAHVLLQSVGMQPGENATD